MDIEDIQNSLNDFEANPVQVIGMLLNETAKNQAILNVLLENQLTIMRLIDDTISHDAMAQNFNERINKHLAIIQANLSSKF